MAMIRTKKKAANIAADGFRSRIKDEALWLALLGELALALLGPTETTTVVKRSVIAAHTNSESKKFFAQHLTQ